jgi:hypothetical protein
MGCTCWTPGVSCYCMWGHTNTILTPCYNQTDGLYLLDTGRQLLLYVGPELDPAVFEAVFNRQKGGGTQVVTVPTV